MLFHSAEIHDELDRIDLWESFVLDWGINKGKLIIEVELVLFPDHSAYKKPTLNEWACFRCAKLIFHDVTGLEGYSDLRSDNFSVDASGEKGYGHIEDFQFTRLGDFKFTMECAGKLKFRASKLCVEFTEV